MQKNSRRSLKLLVHLTLATSAFLAPIHAATHHVAQQHSKATDAGVGTAEQPWKTVTKAAERARAGDTVIIHAGVYRESVLIEQNGNAQAPLRFESAAGEHVVVTGADRLTNWQRVAGALPIYRTAWPHKFVGWNPQMTHPADPYHRLIGRCEQVIVDRYLLRQVLEQSQLAPGTYFANVGSRELLAWDIAGRDLAKGFVEASVRPEILRVRGEHVQLRGLRFRFAANMAQHGGVILAGRNGLIEDCTFEQMNSSGATFSGEDIVVRRCTFRDNGQLGFGASRAHRLLVTECTIENNNTKGFDRGWEAGGDKLVLCRDVVLERSRFVRNRGNGIWFDIGNTNCTVRECLIVENEDAGIFYEISFHLNAHDNVIVGNGFAQTPGAWGAQAGISLSSSPGCVIERNAIIANREGFNFREQRRTTATIEDRQERAIWNHDQFIRRNIIALNRDAQIRGWFDLKDNRHWPRRAATKADGAGGNTRPADIAAPYGAKTDAGQPQQLSLEDLHLNFANNVYFAAPQQGMFIWGPSWSRHESYGGLADFQQALSIDTGSVVLDPTFANLRALDLRINPLSARALKESYPRGAVPGAILSQMEN